MSDIIANYTTNEGPGRNKNNKEKQTRNYERSHTHTPLQQPFTAHMSLL